MSQLDEDWDSWDPMTEAFVSSRNTVAINPDQDPGCLITGQVTPSSSKLGKIVICDHYSRFGECADGQYCDRLHVKPNAKEKLMALQRTYESNKDRQCLTSNYLSPIELKPNPETLLLVTVTSFTSPIDLYFIAPYDKTNFANHKRDEIEFYIDHIEQSTARTKLAKINQQLAALFDHNYRLDNVNDTIYVSTLVACELGNGQFRRAIVLETDDVLNDIFYYRLLLIDVGTEVKLPRERIHDIKAYCLSEPPIAVHCRLPVKLTSGCAKWSSADMMTLERLIKADAYKLCKIIAFDEAENSFTVDLYDIYGRTSLTQEFLTQSTESALA